MIVNINTQRKEHEIALSREPLALGVLPELSNAKSGNVCYLRRYNQKYPNGSTLRDLYQFISSQRHLKSSSVTSLASYFGFLLRHDFNTEYTFNLNVREQIKGFVSHFYRPRLAEVKKTFTAEEIEDFISKASPKTGTIIGFLFHTAMRAKELISLKWSDCLQLKNGNWEISFLQKGNRRNLIEIDGAIMQKVQKFFNGKTYLFEKKSGGQYSYSGLRKILAKESTMLIGYRMKPHDMRKAYATHMMRCCPEKLKDIMKRGGWTDIRVFYKHYVYEEKLTLDEVPCLYPKHNTETAAYKPERNVKDMSGLEKLRRHIDSMDGIRRQAVAL